LQQPASVDLTVIFVMSVVLETLPLRHLAGG